MKHTLSVWRMFVDFAGKLWNLSPVTIQSCIIEEANVAKRLVTLYDLPGRVSSVALESSKSQTRTVMATPFIQRYITNED